MLSHHVFSEIVDRIILRLVVTAACLTAFVVTGFCLISAY
jgi:hypothetical protein